MLTSLEWCDLQSPHVPIFGVQTFCKSFMWSSGIVEHDFHATEDHFTHMLLTS